MGENFGAMFKRLRIESRQTLREFCSKHGYDPGNISRLERGRTAAPESEEVLTGYAKDLGLKKGSDLWQKFIDVAAAERGKLPADLLEDEKLVEKLPVLFRALRGASNNGDAASLERLVEKIRKA